MATATPAVAAWTVPVTSSVTVTDTGKLVPSPAGSSRYRWGTANAASPAGTGRASDAPSPQSIRTVWAWVGSTTGNAPRRTVVPPSSTAGGSRTRVRAAAPTGTLFPNSEVPAGVEAVATTGVPRANPAGSGRARVKAVAASDPTSAPLTAFGP